MAHLGCETLGEVGLMTTGLGTQDQVRIEQYTAVTIVVTTFNMALMPKVSWDMAGSLGAISLT